jgi:hypothetical protein
VSFSLKKVKNFKNFNKKILRRFTMKKLITLFAILVAFSATTFAASENATVTVNAYTAIVVTVDGVADPENVLVGGSSVVTFTGTFTYDATWTTGGFITDWTNTNTGGTWTETSELGGSYVVTLTGAVHGANTVTATYTVNYPF